jgi:RNA polymerase sigma-70 factor (ECF subfamily)
LDRQRSIRLQEDLSALDVLDDSTQELLEFDELRSRLEELIVALPEKYAVVYRMHKEEDLTHREIAQRMKLSEQAVNSRLVRARKSLSAGLQHYFSTFLL